MVNYELDDFQKRSKMDYKKELTHLEKQLNYLDDATLEIAPSKIGYSELTSVIGPMLNLNHGTGKSIKLLAENNHLRDLVILSRPFIEGLINIAFICSTGKKAILKSKKYAYQKGYRDLFREISINGFEIRNGLNIYKDFIDKHRPQNLVEALEEYTTKQGGEKTSWTNETTKQKIEVIGSRYGKWVNNLLTFAFFNIYRDVSEIIHGSYYGVLIVTGMQNRDIAAFKSAAEAAQYFTDRQFELGTLILQQTSISIVALIEVLSLVFKDLTTIQEVKDRSYNTLVAYADNTKRREPN